MFLRPRRPLAQITRDQKDGARVLRRVEVLLRGELVELRAPAAVDDESGREHAVRVEHKVGLLVAHLAEVRPAQLAGTQLELANGSMPMATEWDAFHGEHADDFHMMA